MQMPISYLAEKAIFSNQWWKWKYGDSKILNSLGLTLIFITKNKIFRKKTFKKSEDQMTQDFEWYLVSSSCKNHDFLQALKSSYDPLTYFSDIFISGKNTRADHTKLIYLE